MASKAVDGQENPLSVFQAAKLQSVGQKHVTLWGYMNDPLIFVVNKDVWASWTPEDREIVRQAAIDAGREEIAIARKGLVEAGKPLVKELEALGVTVTDLNAEQRKAFAEMWTRFNRHFRIARYAQLPPAKMGEAVEYLVGMEVKAAAAALPSGKQEITESPIQARMLDQFPKDMGTGRKQALKKIEGIMKDFYGLRDTVRLFTHPGGYSCGRSMSEKDQYDILLNLYRAADANLAAAYNALEAGYRMGREIGRG
jgi:hypothetical protein